MPISALLRGLAAVAILNAISAVSYAQPDQSGQTDQIKEEAHNSRDSPGVGTEQTYESRAAAAALRIPKSTRTLRTSGYATAGDGGAARYIRVNTQASYAGFQSADGAYWALNEVIVHPEMAGGLADGKTDIVPALDQLMGFLGPYSGNTLPSGGRIEFSCNRTYYAGSSVNTTGKHGVKLIGCGNHSTVITAKGGNYPVFYDNGYDNGNFNTINVEIANFTVRCGGNAKSEAHGVKWALSNTGSIHDNFFLSCNHALDVNRQWQTQIYNNRIDGAGEDATKICLYMPGPISAADKDYNNSIIASNNVCQLYSSESGYYGARIINAQGSIFHHNQWMGGYQGIYYCDPPVATYPSGAPFLCQFVFFDQDQVDSVGNANWYFVKGLAATMGRGVVLEQPWAGNGNGYGFAIDGATGLQINNLELEGNDVGVGLNNTSFTTVSGHIYTFNRHNTRAAGLQFTGTTSNNVAHVLMETTHPMEGYNGIVETGSHSNNQYWGGRAPCTLGLGLGGTANTATLNTCEYEVQGTRVDLQFRIAFKGGLSGKGAAVLTGLPVQSQASGTNAAAEGGINMILGISGMKALGGPILLQPVGGATSANLYMQASTGSVALDSANFGNSPTLAGHISYFKN
ncbi:hypothetical protein FBZ87_11342 [Nitrospirillum amazonense]|uniref:Parallel beta helix pectate lyase-like protein n=1 Tax=Nitrospirillum amazonense TaxID=28077 RepID=A0A560JBC4_9PROT|nr:hypothetical protein [Nitrospirillum amazonense]TWB67799.1 hypothetical protein FBZ87_11342 [Nitrospirillum amazonense]